jgi:hypothetical protein
MATKPPGPPNIAPIKPPANIPIKISTIVRDMAKAGCNTGFVVDEIFCVGVDSGVLAVSFIKLILGVFL